MKIKFSIIKFDETNFTKAKRMKLQYNEAERSLEINDGQKPVFIILKILMLLNLVNALIRLVRKPMKDYGTLEYFWVGIGLLSLILLLLFVFVTSSAGKIHINDIKGLKEKTVFGKQRFQLELKNGKKRMLGRIKDANELTQMHELFEKLGIPKN